MNAETKKRIRQFIAKHRGSQGELAQMVGVSESFLSQWLRGRSTSARLDAEVPAKLEELKGRVIERGSVKVEETFGTLIALGFGVVNAVVPYVVE